MNVGCRSLPWSVGQRHEHTLNSPSHRKSSTGMEKTFKLSEVEWLSDSVCVFSVSGFLFFYCAVGILLRKAPLNKQANKKKKYNNTLVSCLISYRSLLLVLCSLTGLFFPFAPRDYRHSGAKLSRCATSTAHLQSLIMATFAIKGMLPDVVESVKVKILSFLLLQESGTKLCSERSAFIWAEVKKNTE